ncbi:hypothetical protein DTL21_28415 [Bremerella cremea]|uniref:Uncharacterized protein n=1 Tax=Blastopirellula marina TaxID=124 RepID=A0A2S8F8N3_9BACT|nr:hypothetical protein C5Y83_28365 [Blastopirellula marina]RCS41896.1 hypothetical protein DTL21_28415 [Bremerella cremea]
MTFSSSQVDDVLSRSCEAPRVQTRVDLKELQAACQLGKIHDQTIDSRKNWPHNDHLGRLLVVHKWQENEQPPHSGTGVIRRWRSVLICS